MCECFAEADGNSGCRNRTWNSLRRFVKRGEKGILVLAPMVGRREQPKEEIATEIESANTADERKALLRHADVKTTLQLYAHSISEDRMLAQGEVLQAILGSSDSANCGLTAD